MLASSSASRFAAKIKTSARAQSAACAINEARVIAKRLDGSESLDRELYEFEMACWRQADLTKKAKSR